MVNEERNARDKQPAKPLPNWLILRLLLIFERAIFWFLYSFTMMENDEVFVNNRHKPRSPNSPKSPKEFRTLMNSDHKDRTRATSVPHMSAVPAKHSPSSFNPVKDFIANFVNFKGPKKRSSIKRSVTTENVTDETAPVRHVGRGHSFLPCHLRNPTWCDCCGEFIWGLFKQCVRCKNCKYTCHKRCQELVDLDCTGGWQLGRMNSVDEMTMKTLHLIKQGEKRKEPFMLHSESPKGTLLQKKIEEFNSATTGLIMTMRGLDEYQGFIRVHMNLIRPINVIAGERPLSIFETVGGQKEDDQKKTQRTSFFLPLGTVKALHVTSETTVHEMSKATKDRIVSFKIREMFLEMKWVTAGVIVALLKKFKVADNPRKFALFECYQEEDNHMILRRMSDFEKPLVLRLLWGGADIRHNFSLQENETGDIIWEVFSLPELQNFMKILDKEEEEHITQVEEKYRVYKERLQKALALAQGKTPAEESIGEQRPPTDNYVQDEKPYKEIAEPEEDLAKDESVC